MNDEPIDDARKKCMQCGEVVELLRFRCPGCGLEMFDVVSAAPELVEEMYGRQQRSMQHVDQGGRLFKQGLADEAVDEFERAIEADRWNATAHGNIGVIHLRAGDPAEALRWFERALEIDPRLPGGKEMVDAARHQTV